MRSLPFSAHTTASLTAARVIARFGGAAVVARALDIAPATVARWPYDGGAVPHCHRGALLAHAERIGLPVVAADFICDDPVHLCVGLADWWREAGGAITGLDAWLTEELAARGMGRRQGAAGRTIGVAPRHIGADSDGESV